VGLVQPVGDINLVLHDAVYGVEQPGAAVHPEGAGRREHGGQRNGLRVQKQ